MQREEGREGAREYKGGLFVCVCFGFTGQCASRFVQGEVEVEWEVEGGGGGSGRYCIVRNLSPQKSFRIHEYNRGWW